MLFFKRNDGGENSGVIGFWLIEIKWLFSIVLLKFQPNSRENYHSHAFNALTFWVKGKVVEETIDLKSEYCLMRPFKAGNLKYTPKNNIHKIHCQAPAWALSLRGPWDKTWIEFNMRNKKVITLGRHREVLKEERLKIN